MKLNLSLATIFTLISGIQGFSTPSSNPEVGVSRRESFAKVASSIVSGAAVASTILPNAAIAYPSDETPKVTTRMGGLLVSFYRVCCLLFIYCLMLFFDISKDEAGFELYLTSQFISFHQIHLHVYF